jgi:hypothetical protein
MEELPVIGVRFFESTTSEPFVAGAPSGGEGNLSLEALRGDPDGACLRAEGIVLLGMLGGTGRLEVDDVRLEGIALADGGGTPSRRRAAATLVGGGLVVCPVFGVSPSDAGIRPSGRAGKCPRPRDTSAPAVSIPPNSAGKVVKNDPCFLDCLL